MGQTIFGIFVMIGGLVWLYRPSFYFPKSAWGRHISWVFGGAKTEEQERGRARVAGFFGLLIGFLLAIHLITLD
jgi:hypothetical protein